MTDIVGSRNTADATLADVLEVLEKADIAKRTRDDLCSALRTVGRVLNRPLDQILVTPALLRRRLATVSPVAAGLSMGRWANVRSLLRFALNVAQRELPRSQRRPMSFAWSILFRSLANRSARMRLTRLLRYLSALGIEPSEVTPQHLESFGAELHEDPLIKNPNTNLREAAGVWNAARTKVGGWPDIEFPVESRRKTYTLAWEMFPQELKQDATAYLTRLSSTDLLEELSFRPVCESTRRTRERQILSAASALVHRGKDPKSLHSLADLVEFSNFKAILRFFVERRGDTTSSAIEQLGGFLKSVARHWVRSEASLLSQMSAVVKRLSAPQHGMTPKNRDRLRVFYDIENVLALLHLPRRLMKDAMSRKISASRAALLAQTAVAVELLLVRPLRIGNLTTLRLDRHLIRPKRSSSLWHVTIPEDEVKNKVNLDHELPAESGALLDEYLRRFRPLLCKPGNPALFPGRNGVGNKAKHTLAGQICNAVHRYTGLKVHSHLFRHFAGFVHLSAHPGEYAVVTQVLGQKSMNTAKAHYLGLETDAAVRHFDKTIADLRAGRSSDQTKSKLAQYRNRRRKPKAEDS